MNARGRTYVVTGSASGIGEATANQLRRGGATVIGVDLDDADIKADLSTAQGRRSMIDEISAELDALDAVVACAGTNLREPVAVSTNFFGAVATLDGLRPLLARGAQARAVAVASIAATERPIATIVEACLALDERGACAAAEAAMRAGNADPIYGSSKRALVCWVRQVAITDAWAGAGIAVNVVAPGVIRTPMTRRFFDDPELLTRLKERAPMPFHGPGGEPTDVAELILWLCSPANRIVTGQVIFADGGADACLRGAHAW